MRSEDGVHGPFPAGAGAGWTRRAVRRFGGRAVLLAAIAIAAIRGWSYARSFRGLDFYQFWAVGRHVARSGGSDVYDAEGRARIGDEVLAALPRDDASQRLAAAVSRRRTLETYSTPFLYAVAGLLPTDDYDRAHALHVAASLLLGIGGVLLLCRVLRYPPLAAAAAVLLLEAYAPYRSDLRVGNVNLIQLGLLALALAASARPRGPRRVVVVGAILGVAVLFKPNVALAAATLLGGWAVRRAGRRVAGAVAGMSAAVLGVVALSSAWFRSAAAWGRWARAILDLPPEIVPVRTGNFSLARLLGGDAAVRLAPLLAIAALGAVAASLEAGRRRAAAAPTGAPGRPEGEDVALAGLGCLAYLVASPLVWIHYFVLALPIALWLLRPPEPGAGARARRAAAAVALVLLANRPLEAIVGQGHPGLVAATSIAGALLLLGAACRELARSRAPAPA